MEIIKDEEATKKDKPFYVSVYDAYNINDSNVVIDINSYGATSDVAKKEIVARIEQVKDELDDAIQKILLDE